ncbi:MAG: DUF3990 domain-containing protein [Prevotella sp.]|jgi:hypothetical protein|nr:DUF3990 domain-containing protein [Prevotella sp.]
MKVYHGSYTVIREIDLEKCLYQRDFGRGFYVTKFRKHAENWARIIGKKHKTQGAVTEFEYTESPFANSICKIKHFDRYDEEWFDFVVSNRQNEKTDAIHDFDIVEGPVADDKVQNRIYSYLEGKISKPDFLNKLTYHETTHQICFCTHVSLQLLKNINNLSNIISEISEIGEPLVEQLMLDLNIDEVKAADIFYSSATFGKLADISTEFYKKNWAEIYGMLKKER